MSVKKREMKDLNVLIVDDQPDTLALIKNMMNEAGISRIFEAGDGRKALDFMDSAFDVVDMIICDWNMPKMTGVELLRQVRSVYPDIPFLMVTGRGDMDSVVEAKSSGVTGYIVKPFSASQLEAKLRVVAHTKLL